MQNSNSMKKSTLLPKHSSSSSLLLLLMLLCNLSITLTHAIFNERSNGNGNKEDGQYVDFLDETLKKLYEVFGDHDADNQAAIPNKLLDGNKLDINSNSISNSNSNDDLNVNNNAINDNDNKNNTIAAPEETQSFYSEIETTLEQAADNVESLWLQFKQSLFGLVPDVGSAGKDDDNGNVVASQQQQQKQQIKPIETAQPTPAAQPTTITTKAAPAISDKINAENTLNTKSPIAASELNKASEANQANVAEQNLKKDLS